MFIEPSIGPMRYYTTNYTRGLFDLTKKLLNAGKTHSMAEVGCYCGESTVHFACVFDSVIAVDIWEGGWSKTDVTANQDFRKVESNFDFLTRNFKNIRKIKGESNCVSSTFVNGQFDFVYLDGNHSYDSVINDMNSWWRKTNRCMGGHDYNMASVKEAVNEFLQTNNISTNCLTTYCDNSWLILIP